MPGRKRVENPEKGEAIRFEDDRLVVPDKSIIPFIEGDGTGPDIWRGAVRVFEAAVKKAYQGKRELQWMEVLAGEKANRLTGNPLPQETIRAFQNYLVGIKGPLTTPVGGGIRSLNVALRQKLDLYVCLRPVHWIKGVPSVVRHPEKVDMVIFRENTEDVYAGLELKEGTEEVRKLIDFCEREFDWKIRPDSGVGIKPISQTASKHLVRAAVEYTLKHKRKSVTLVHKGNIQKFTEGSFRNWGYEVAQEDYPDKTVSWEECQGKAPEGKILIKDVMADIFFQHILTRPEEFDVIATTNLNGDYISDALSAQVGGIGISPGANINFTTGHAIFEATHGTAPKYANQDKVNPTSLILSGVMMFDYIGWNAVSDLIVDALSKTILEKRVTYDLERHMKGATRLSTSQFASAIIENIEKK